MEWSKREGGRKGGRAPPGAGWDVEINRGVPSLVRGAQKG